MISKKNRLIEKELKKVLQRGKPFFSYGIVLNYLPNTISMNRFGIILSTKSVSTNVTRNFFRRHFYSLIQKNFLEITLGKSYDFVFVVKKEKFLDKKDEKSIRDFAQDIQFLVKKMESSLSKGQ